MGNDLAAAGKRLTERKNELLAQSQASAQARDTVTLDQQSVGRLSRMDAMQQQAMAEANERARTAEMSRIDAALVRIDDGDYGNCIDCGEEIAPKRLEINPSATLCIGCAEALVP